MTTQDLQIQFVKLLKEFIEYRKTHGGICVPDLVVVESAFDSALYETGLLTRTKSIPIIGEKSEDSSN